MRGEVYIRLTCSYDSELGAWHIMHVKDVLALLGRKIEWLGMSMLPVFYSVQADATRFQESGPQNKHDNLPWADRNLQVSRGREAMGTPPRNPISEPANVGRYRGQMYSGTWELGTPKGLSKTVLNSEVVLFLWSISIQWINLRTEVAVLNFQVVPIS